MSTFNRYAKTSRPAITVAVLLGLVVSTTAAQRLTTRPNGRLLYDGQYDAAPLYHGDNVLSIFFVSVWDNGEGVSPDGRGSDYAPYYIPAQVVSLGFWELGHHGPYGNLYIVIYAPEQAALDHWDNSLELDRRVLRGPHYTHEDKFEWLDREEMEYVNYGIFDWDSSPYDRVFVRVFESDSGPLGHKWGRQDDDLAWFVLTRGETQESYARVRMPKSGFEIVLRTIDYPKLQGPRPRRDRDGVLYGPRTDKKKVRHGGE